MLVSLKVDETLLERFKKWLERKGYAKKSCVLIPRTVKHILLHYGYFRDEEELREYLLDNTSLRARTRTGYVRCYRLFVEFVKNGKAY